MSELLCYTSKCSKRFSERNNNSILYCKQQVKSQQSRKQYTDSKTVLV